MLGKTNVKVKSNKKVNYVEYIESTGTQYIDTGYIGNENTKVKLLFETGVYDDYGIMLFGRYIDSSQSISVTIGGTGINSNTRFGNAVQGLTNWERNMLYRLEMSKEGLIINDNVYAWSSTNTFSTSLTLLIGDTGNVTTLHRFIGKIYSCKIYDNDVLVRDFKPCKDGAGVYCLYDEVEKRYYYNQGSGEFLGGVAA